MGTKFMYDGRSIEPQCEISHSDTFPCFDFLDSNLSSDYVDLVCSASHFVRMNIELDPNGKPILKNGDDNKIISDFVNAQKLNYSQMPDADKEMFEDFVGFTSIKHTYGAAVSMRVLMEDFFKNNFLAPAINTYLSNSDRQKLFEEARSKQIPFLSLSLQIITFGELLKMMVNGVPPASHLRGTVNLKKALRNSFLEYITIDPTGKVKRLSKDESDTMGQIFGTISKVVHGAHFDALQIFKESLKFFDLLTVYFKQKHMKWL